MTNYYGARYNMAKKIDKHLFIISPNNSGSTYLMNVLATSSHTWNLSREGQHVFGYKGVPKMDLTWASSAPSLDSLTDASLYGWDCTKKAWYFQAFSKNRDADVFVTKAPPFLVITDMLKANFKNPHFIILVRNPYAVVEGICRREGVSFKAGNEKYKVAARHIMTCFEYQKKNIETYGDDLFFSYEQMCKDPVHTERKIKKFIPELSDLILKQTIVVKNMYFEDLRDMNTQQIERLTPKDIRQINTVFRKYKDLMDYFGYELLTEN